MPFCFGMTSTGALPSVRRDHLTRAASFDGFQALCEECGLDAALLLRRAGLDPACLATPDVMIPYRAYLHVLQDAAHASRLPHIGLLLADRQTLAMLGPVGFLVSEAPSLRAAITQLGDYIHLHNQALALRMEVINGLAYWSYETLAGDLPGLALEDDHILATGVNMLRHFLGRGWNPERIGIQHAAPATAAAYRKKFCCPIEFAAERNHVVFDARVLDQPLSGNNSRLHAILDGYIKHLDSSEALGLDQQIQRVLLQALKVGDCSLQGVAASLAMTPRSLQRRLADSGTSFQAELDTARNSVARRYLQDSKMPLTAISTLLGYADLAAFSRAFKRLNGVPPQTWRRQLKV